MTDKHWNWDHLRFFLSLAEHSTLSAAGRELDVSHSTVLRRVRSFEASLETRLFEQTSAGYQLTNAGIELHEHARQMKFALDAVARDIAGADQAVAGEIVIATTDSLSYLLLPELVKDLRELHKDLKFKILMGSQMSKVENHEVDIAIRTCKEPPDELIGRRIGSIKFAACAAPEYVLRHQLTDFPSATDEFDFIKLTDGFCGIPFYDWFHKQLGPDTHTIEVNNFLLAAAMCRAGLGITVLPSYMLENDKDLQELGTKSPIPQNTLWILCHSELRDTERVRRVRHFLFNALSELFSGPQAQSSTSSASTANQHN